MLQTAYTGASRREGLYHLPANADSRIADIGCGFGAGALEMAEHFGAEVRGFDQDAGRLAVADQLRLRFPDIGSRVQFIAQDVTAYIPATPFDVLTARFVLQYLPVQQTLAHWRSWLNPGGSLYLEEVDDGWTVEYPPAPVAWQRVIDAYKHYARENGWDRELGRKLAHHLVAAGYRLTRVQWNPRSALSIEQDSDLQVRFERERLTSVRTTMVEMGLLTDDEFEEGLVQFEAAYPKMTFITGATIQIWATV